jgi:outer membrane protein TolC
LIKAEKAALVDRMRTEVRLADIDQLLVREKNLLAIQHRALINLLGRNTPMKEISIEGELGRETTTNLPDLETSLARAWLERADYLAACSALEAKAHYVDAAKAGYWPNLGLQGAYGGRWAAGAKEGAGDEQGDVGRLGLVVEVPLFEGGQTDARVREESARLAAAQEHLRAVVFQIQLDVETALLNIESSRKRASAIEKAIAQAKEGLRIEQQKYDLGKGAIVDVLDAQNALLDTETTYYRVLAEFHTALAQLKLATGEE